MEKEYVIWKGDWKDSVITSEKPDTHICQVQE